MDEDDEDEEIDEEQKKKEDDEGDAEKEGEETPISPEDLMLRKKEKLNT